MDEIIKLMKERAETLRKGIARAEKDVGTFPVVRAKKAPV